MNLMEQAPQGVQDSPFGQGLGYWSQAANPTGADPALMEALMANAMRAMGQGPAATPTPMPTPTQGTPFNQEAYEVWKQAQEQWLKNLPLIMRDGGAPEMAHQITRGTGFMPRMGHQVTEGTGFVPRMANRATMTTRTMPRDPEERRRKELDEKRQRAGRGPQR